jgi:hypothetical protein
MALPVVLYGLVMIAALAAAAFWMLLSDRRAGRATIALQKAMGDAERATLAPLEAWEVARYNSMAVGTTLEFPGPGGMPLATVRRLSLTIFELIGAGFGEGKSGVQRAGLLVHLPFPLEILPGPLVTAGPVVADPGGGVGGRRGPPGGGVCTSKAARFAPRADARVHDPGPDRFENLPAWLLLSNKVVSPGRYVGVRPSRAGPVCLLQDVRNWGAPDAQGSPCHHYWPVILVRGDLDLHGGVGQGVLIVEGDLLLGGGFTFAGLILVGGDLRIRGEGTRVVGAVQVGGPAGGVSTHLGGGVRIDYAPCLVRRAMAVARGAVPLPSRAWFYPIR